MTTIDEQAHVTGKMRRCRQCLPVALTICVGLGCTLAVSGLVRQLETSTGMSEFDREAADEATAIVKGVEADLLVLVAGLLLTGCVAGFQVIGIGRAHRVQRLVEKQTRELRESTTKLRGSEERFRGFAERSSDVIFMLDAQGNIEYASPSAERIWSFKPSEVVGKSYLEFMSEADRPRLAEEFVAVVRQGQERLAEFTGVKKGGETFAAEVSAYPILVDDKVTGVQGLVRDITARKQAEEEIKRAQADLEQILNAGAPMIVVGSDKRILRVNDRYCDLLGTTKAEIIGRKCSDIQSNRRCGTSECCVRRVQNSSSSEIEETRSFEGREPVTCLVHFYPYCNPEGEIVGVVQTVTDVSELKRAEEALRKKDEQLRQKQKMEAIGGLAGGVAHEFNNLLQAIQGYTSFAMGELEPAAQPYQDLQQAMSAADRAAALARQLLSFSRQRPLDRRAVDPNQVVREFVRMARPLVGEHIEVEVLLDPSLSCVCADANMLEQMLMNLCVNARDAMPSGGRLTISTDGIVITTEGAETRPYLAPGHYARIMVTDTGCGMTPAVRDRVFEPFFTTKEVGKGTGLGMATVYSIVQQHGGAIHVYSEPGQGTTFRIYLPVHADTPTIRPELSAPPLSRGNETILIAEDEPLVRDVAVRILRKAGYSTIEAENGQQAVELVEENGDAVSLALLDVVMPKMSGHDAYRRIINLQPQIKAIFCTGYDPAAERAQPVVEDGLRLVEKPFVPETLLRAVREILDADGPAPRPTEPVAGLA